MNNQTLSGSVVSGQRLGRKIGFPTANINISDIGAIEQGVWVVRAKVSNIFYWGVANIGYRPSVKNNSTPILEVFIFDFSDDIYGKELEVTFIKHLREEKKFDSLEQLKMAIANDAIDARDYISNYETLKGIR